MTVVTEQVNNSRYLDYLPAIFREGEAESKLFLGRFLLAFEQILSGTGGKPAGLGETIDRLHTYFTPQDEHGNNKTPADFLPWLAGWVALSLRADWKEDEQRRLLANIVPLYRLRGTAAGLAQMLNIYTGMGVEIYELTKTMQVGITSTIGSDTAVGGGLPYYFIVKLNMVGSAVDPNFERRVQIARAIIEQEKPAHTYYSLQIALPTIQIGVHATLGKDTLIGMPAVS